MTRASHGQRQQTTPKLYGKCKMLLPRIVALCFLLIATESRAGTAAPAGTAGTPGSASSCAGRAGRSEEKAR